MTEASFDWNEVMSSKNASAECDSIRSCQIRPTSEPSVSVRRDTEAVDVSVCVRVCDEEEEAAAEAAACASVLLPEGGVEVVLTGRHSQWCTTAAFVQTAQKCGLERSGPSMCLGIAHHTSTDCASSHSVARNVSDASHDNSFSGDTRPAVRRRATTS